MLLPFFSCQEAEKEKLDQLEYSNEKIKEGVIYEVNVRQYSESGTFNDFTKDIPKLRDLGVKILWLMPIPVSYTHLRAHET